ncbi:MAG: elongation factor G [Clostridiaceae bacterium]|nr:elongation factor G [Clostridiaceae bacterium]
MINYPAEKVRNITLLGHGGSGKTALAEAMLFCAKSIDRMGRSTDGNTTMDFDPEEIRRQISINTTIAACEWKNTKMNIIDTPGDFDFLGETMAGIRVADSAIVVLASKGGIQVGAEKAVRLLKKKNVPYMFFVNRIDEPNADFENITEELRSQYGVSVIPLSIPIVSQEKITGIIDVMNKRAFSIDAKGASKEIPFPGEYEERVTKLHEQINEVVAESDEELMEKYFSGEPFTEDEFRRGIHAGFREGSLHPIFAGSALNNWGVELLMNSISKDTPSAGAKKSIAAESPDGNPIEVTNTDTEPMSAFVFKTIADPFVGRISLFRVYSGVFKGNTTVYNADKEKEERVGGLFYMVGKKQVQADQVGSGDIGAVAKLVLTQTNDTLCDKQRPVILPKISFPTPCLTMGIVPKVKGEEDKIVAGLNKLADEDPVFTVVNDPETRQIVISGLGEQEINVLKSKLKNKFNVDADLEEPRVPYREAIRKKVKVQGKHKKQSGGHGQYGDVWIEFEPVESDTLVFEEKVFGGSVPKNYFPAVEKGLMDSVGRGVLAGFPVVNLKATLVDGSYHDVDSSEMAFKIAAGLAFKNGLPQAGPVLLEPISSVTVHIPEDKQGDIMGDMNKRRGRIMGIDADEDGSVISCEVPTAEMASYATDLKSMTQGRGWYTIQHARYEQAPSDVASKVIEERKALLEEDE